MGTLLTEEAIIRLINRRTEKKKESANSEFSPLYLETWDEKPLLVGYIMPSFQVYNGRKDNAREHVIRFIESFGLFRKDEELRMREFSKTLNDRAYSRYSYLPPGAFRTWGKCLRASKTPFTIPLSKLLLRYSPRRSSTIEKE